MARKLAAALLSLSVLSFCTLHSSAVYALGLGPITMNSALGAPLDADIELLQIRDLTLQEILPGLGSREDFDKANVDRNFFLTGLRFRVIYNGDGTGYVKVTSTAPAVEPFLNFLVETHWPQGRLLREYTLLLDPPAFVEGDQAEPVLSARSSRPADRQSAANTVERAKPAQNQTYQPPSRRVSRSVSQPSYQPSSSSQVAGDYVTRSNDGLWGVALKLRPSSAATIQQTMLAIQQKNPSAFEQGNINRLKSGQVLRAPTLEETRSVSRSQAVAEVRRQNDDWKNRRSTAQRPPKQPQAAPISGRDVTDTETADKSNTGSLTLVSESPDGASEGSTSGQEGSLGGGRRVLDLENKLAAIEDNLAKADLVNQDLQAKLTDIGEQVTTSEKLLSLKDDQIALLQARLAELEKQGSTAKLASDEDESVSIESAIESVVEEVADTDGDYNFVEGEETTALDRLNKQLNKDSSDVAVSSLDVTDDLTSNQELSELTDTIAPEPTVKPAGIIQQILDNTMALAGIAVGLVVLVALFLFGRNRSSADDDVALGPDSLDTVEDLDLDQISGGDDEQFFAATGVSSIGPSDPLLDGLQNDGSLEDDNFAGSEFEGGDVPDSELSLDDFGDFGEVDDELGSSLEGVDTDGLSDAAADTDAFDSSADASSEPKDVLAEVDIYIAYGRMQHAIDFLATAISKEPNNSSYRIKLLEVYAELGDKDNFENTQLGLAELGDEDANRDANLLAEKFDDMDSAEEDNLLNISLDDDDAEFSLDDSSADTDAEPAGDDISIGLDADDLSDDDFDLDLDDAISEDSSSEVDDAVLEESSASLDDSLDASFDVSDSDAEAVGFDSDLADSESSADDLETIDEAAAASIASELDSDFDFSEVDESDAKPQAIEEGSFEEVSDSDLDDSIPDVDDDLSLELDDGVVDSAPAMAAGDSKPKLQLDSDDLADDVDEFDEEDLSFLSDSDEIATKLDLARAYIDMGDRDGAKDILAEVMGEGDSDQQQDAKDLIAKMG